MYKGGRFSFMRSGAQLNPATVFTEDAEHSEINEAFKRAVDRVVWSLTGHQVAQYGRDTCHPDIFKTPS